MHTCNICDKTFKFPSGLSRHRNIHEEDYKVKCECGSTFSRSDNLKRHQLKCIPTPTSQDESVSDFVDQPVTTDTVKLEQSEATKNVANLLEKPSKLKP